MQAWDASPRLKLAHRRYNRSTPRASSASSSPPQLPSWRAPSQTALRPPLARATAQCGVSARRARPHRGRASVGRGATSAEIEWARVRFRQRCARAPLLRARAVEPRLHGHMEASACCAPLTVERGERPVTRRRSRQTSRMSGVPKADNESSLLASLPSELLLRVVRSARQRALHAARSSVCGLMPVADSASAAWPLPRASLRDATRRPAHCFSNRGLPRRRPSFASPRVAPRISQR